MARATPHRQDPTSGVLANIAFVKIGATRFDLSDPYHLALTARWPAFALGVFALYGLITAAFAGLYLAAPGCVANAMCSSAPTASTAACARPMRRSSVRV